MLPLFTLFRPPGYTEDQLQAAREEFEKTPKEKRFSRYINTCTGSYCFRFNYQKKLRWCLKCEQFKPPRSHHCSACKRCIPLMDHHCPWINQCVGYKNRKSFILFALYSSIGILWVAALLIRRVIGAFQFTVSILSIALTFRII
jgi:hypothetical protein